MSILGPIYAQDPQRIAVEAGGERLDYARLGADIDTMARWLLGRGLVPGDRVSLLVEAAGIVDYWDWIMHLGAIRAGLKFSTRALPASFDADPAFGPHAAAIGLPARIPETAQPAQRIAFHPTSGAPLAAQLGELAEPAELAELEAATMRLNATSGTTGTPKVIAWDQARFAERLEQVEALGDIAPDTRLLPLLGLITTTGLRYPLCAWRLGATVLLQSLGRKQSDMAQLTGSCTFLATSPFRMERIVERVPGAWPGRESRLVELFGGRVAPALRRAAERDCGADVRLSYGATEAGRVAAGPAALIERHPGAAGIVEPGVEVEILGPDGAPLPPGEEGAVRIRSDFTGEPYLGASDPDPAASPFRDGWFHPGDRGVLFADGLLAITGRTVETINIAGAKLPPAQLEDPVRAMPGIADACVLALRRPQGDLLTVAVVCAPGRDIKALQQEIQRLLPSPMPLLVVRVSAIPRNAMGRIPRERFAARLAARLPPLGKARQPAG